MLILGPGGQLCWYGLHAITTACVPQVAVAMHPSNSQSNPAVPILFMTGDDDIVVLPATVQAQYTRAHGVEKVFVENSDNQHTDATGAPLLPLLSRSSPPPPLAPVRLMHAEVAFKSARQPCWLSACSGMAARSLLQHAGWSFEPNGCTSCGTPTVDYPACVCSGTNTLRCDALRQCTCIAGSLPDW